MLVLYHHPASTCSQKVRLVLFHKGLPWESELIDLQRGEHLRPEYLAINPNGVVPALTDNHVPVYDSSAMNEYLDDAYPELPLRPARPLDRAHMRSWCRYIDEVPTAAIRVPSFNRYFAQNWAHWSEQDRQAHADQLPLRKHFFLRMNARGFDTEETKASHEQLRSCLERMDRALRDHEWVAGETYSLADIGLTPTVVRLEDLGMTELWTDLPAVVDWYNRILARSNFAPTFEAPARLLHLLTPSAEP